MEKIDLTQFKGEKWDNFNEILEYVEDCLLDEYHDAFRNSFHERYNCAEILDKIGEFRFVFQTVADIEPLLKEE